METCTGFSGALQLVIVAWVFVAPAAFSQIRGCDPRDRICLEAIRGLVTTSETAEEQLYWATQINKLNPAETLALNRLVQHHVSGGWGPGFQLVLP